MRINDELVTESLRVIHLHMRQYGLHCPNYQHLFPEIASHQTFNKIKYILERNYNPDGEYVGLVQIVYHLPDYEPTPLTYHTDVPPEGYIFTKILGVPLNEWYVDNGTVVTKRYGYLLLDPGEVFEIPVDDPHSPGNNLSGLPRIGLYYRWTKKLKYL